MKKLAQLLVLVIVITFSSKLYAQGELGSKNCGLVNFKGNIYFIESDIEIYSENIEKQKSEGVIYTNKLDVPTRNFTQGFPGVSDRFEYFGIVYKAYFEITTPGTYKFRISSDDGSKLWIDKNMVIDNDGVHGEQTGEGTFELTKGMHAMKIWYFQGPATEIALQLFVTKPESEEEVIFDLKDFNEKLNTTFKNLNATTTEEGIKIQLPDKILFETGKSELKTESENAIEQLAQILNSYPEATVRIVGHTDATGDAKTNKELSENRAKSVLVKLKSKKVAETIAFETTGKGSDAPVADNKTEENRAKNRRVEIFIKP